jgi:hypothetical protein
VTPHEQSIADAERLLPGEVFQRATALFTAVCETGTVEDALLACHNLRADLNEPDALRVADCLIVRLLHGHITGDAVSWSMLAEGRAPAEVIDAQPLDVQRNPSGYDDAPAA